MAKGVKFDGCNTHYQPPEGVSEDQCGSLHVFRNGPCIVSAHELTDEELEEIVRTRRVFHSVWSGSTLFPIFIGSETSVREVVVDYGPVWKQSPQPKPVKCHDGNCVEHRNHNGGCILCGSPCI